ncbi:uncharacterized protein LOC108332798 [Vigna angularis]|uniref:uncharacterized protein LOC108332798 n=1 Tax=Phaseolus angularis TaxID=3914 RepID=UPI00080A4DE3|nr:uncharacterized protein LOC108332798 [Vigna angularis]
MDDTLQQFIQMSESHRKNTKAACRRMEAHCRFIIQKLDDFGGNMEVPDYVNFLKKFNKKRKSPEEETVEVQSNCSVILQKALPPKANDPKSFNIPCTIGSHERGKALIDLGSSINLMPLSVLENITGLEVKPTKRNLLKISWCGDRKENTKIKVGIG